MENLKEELNVEEVLSKLEKKSNVARWISIAFIIFSVLILGVVLYLTYNAKNSLTHAQNELESIKSERTDIENKINELKNTVTELEDKKSTLETQISEISDIQKNSSLSAEEKNKKTSEILALAVNKTNSNQQLLIRIEIINESQRSRAQEIAETLGGTVELKPELNFRKTTGVIFFYTDALTKAKNQESAEKVASMLRDMKVRNVKVFGEKRKIINPDFVTIEIYLYNKSFK